MTSADTRALPAAQPLINAEDYAKAIFNILEDFSGEKDTLEETQRAVFNILEDFSAEKVGLEEMQRAMLNLLEDFDVERSRVEAANKELERHTAELEVSNKELESFSYTVSHDLHAPLRNMDGFSLALLEDYGDKLDDQGKEYLHYIRSSCQLMSRLMDEIIGLSRISRTEIHPEKVNLSVLAREVAHDLKRTQGRRRVDFIITSGLEAQGDRNLLKLVIQNLLGNAFKFTGKCPAAQIEFGVTPKDGEKAYFVRDNGAGFDMAYVDKLFKPFQRLHRTEEYPGTGIGLASVQNIIKRHGGKVWAEGEVEKGATFYFTLQH